jgi:hypothetical protein
MPTDHDTQEMRVTALYDSQADAVDAADEIVALGLSRTDVHLMGAEEQDAPSPRPESGMGLLDGLTRFFLPHDDHAAYAEGLRRGGFMVVAERVPGHLLDAVSDALERRGSVNVDERSETWRSEGWEGFKGSDDRVGATPGAMGGAPDRLGASDHVGQPRSYAESALGALKEDPLPRATRHDSGRAGVRAYRP